MALYKAQTTDEKKIPAAVFLFLKNQSEERRKVEEIIKETITKFIGFERAISVSGCEAQSTSQSRYSMLISSHLSANSLGGNCRPSLHSHVACDVIWVRLKAMGHAVHDHRTEALSLRHRAVLVSK